MKKILSAVLAASMVASMGVSAFADTADKVQDVDGAYPFEYSSTYDYMYDAAPAYGDTIYYALENGTGLVYDYDYVKSTSIRQSWEMGRDAVDSLSIVKKKIDPADGYSNSGNLPALTTGETYYYFLALELSANPYETDSTDVIGEITLKKTSDDYGFAYGGDAAENEIVVDINLEVEFNTDDSDYEVTSTKTTFDFGDGDSEQWITFEAHDGYDYFIVDTCDQDDLVLCVDADYDSDIAALFPEANLHFFNGNYASFNRIGELYLHDCGAMTANYVYAITEDGEVVEVASTYDEYEDAFIINTRTLGRYVLSDVELELTSDVVVEDEVVVTPEADKTNPETGAVA